MGKRLAVVDYTTMSACRAAPGMLLGDGYTAYLHDSSSGCLVLLVWRMLYRFPQFYLCPTSE